MKFPFFLRDSTQFDAVGFGTNAVDHLVRVPTYPDFNSKVELTSHEVMPGGEIASTMVGLARLGLRTAYAGRFGGDAEGQLGLRSLTDEGVNTEFAEVMAGAVTQVAYIIIDEVTGERTIMWKRDQQLSYLAGEAPLPAAALGKVLHITPHDTDAAIQMASEARAAGTIVSVDIDRSFEGVDDLLHLIDILIGSIEFFKEDTGADSGEDVLRRVAARYGTSLVAATMGAEGSIALCNGNFIHTPAFDVPGGCVDTTGAGDAFRTGFLYGLLRGREVEGCCRLANAVAALKCRGSGARSTLPDRTELEEFVRHGRPPISG